MDSLKDYTSPMGTHHGLSESNNSGLLEEEGPPSSAVYSRQTLESPVGLPEAPPPPLAGELGRSKYAGGLSMEKIDENEEFVVERGMAGDLPPLEEILPPLLRESPLSDFKLGEAPSFVTFPTGGNDSKFLSGLSVDLLSSHDSHGSKAWSRTPSFKVADVPSLRNPSFKFSEVPSLRSLNSATHLAATSEIPSLRSLNSATHLPATAEEPATTTMLTNILPPQVAASSSSSPEEVEVAFEPRCIPSSSPQPPTASVTPAMTSAAPAAQLAPPVVFTPAAPGLPPSPPNTFPTTPPSVPFSPFTEAQRKLAQRALSLPGATSEKDHPSSSSFGDIDEVLMEVPKPVIPETTTTTTATMTPTGPTGTPHHLSVTSQKYDIGHKGYLTAVEQTMRSMDTTGQGFLDNQQVRVVVEQTLDLHKDNTQLRHWIFALVAAALILAISNLGTAFAAARLAQDTQVDPDTGLLMVKGNTRVPIVTVNTGKRLEIPVHPANSFSETPFICLKMETLAVLWNDTASGVPTSLTVTEMLTENTMVATNTNDRESPLGFEESASVLGFETNGNSFNATHMCLRTTAGQILCFDLFGTACLATVRARRKLQPRGDDTSSWEDSSSAAVVVPSVPSPLANLRATVVAEAAPTVPPPRLLTRYFQELVRGERPALSDSHRRRLMEAEEEFDHGSESGSFQQPRQQQLLVPAVWPPV